MHILFFLCLFSSIGVVFPTRIKTPMQASVFLNALESGVQIATSPIRRDDTLYKNDIIKVHLDKDIVFKSYCNTHFCQLRRLAGLSEMQFSNSIKVLNTINSDSKSGQHFWKSDNGLLVLKTMPKHESKTMREIIDPYTAHLSESHQPSCLSLVLGMYSISIKGKVTYIICLNNVFPSDLSHVVEMYDIKGSTVGRKASVTSKVMKDLDALTKMRSSDDRILHLSLPQMQLLTRAIKRDTSFLEQLNLMDYSLLIGVEAPTSPLQLLYHPAGDGNRESDSNLHKGSNIERNGNLFQDGVSIIDSSGTEKHSQEQQHANADFLHRGKIIFEADRPHRRYHLGIVDFLQKYTAKKRIETIGKGIWYNVARISAVDAKFYARRFMRFIRLMGGLRDGNDSI